MAKIIRTLTVKLRPNTDSEIEDVTLQAGDEVKLVRTWDRFHLIKDNDGHFYNVPLDAIAV